MKKNLSSFVRFLALMLACIFSFSSIAYAQGDTVPTTDVSTIVGLQSLLSWVVLGGAGLLASWLVDRALLFHSLDTGLRMVAVAGLSIVFATIARVALTLVPADVFSAIDVYFKDWLPYLLPFLWSLSVTFATKSISNGVAKSKALKAFSADAMAS
jgi:hypothetical protein